MSNEIVTDYTLGQTGSVTKLTVQVKFDPQRRETVTQRRKTVSSLTQNYHVVDERSTTVPNDKIRCPP